MIRIAAFVLGIVGIGLFSVSIPVGWSQEKQASPAVVKEDETLDFAESRPILNVRTALYMFGSGGALQAALVRVVAADQALLWDSWHLDIDRVLPLRVDLLHHIKDGTAVPNMADRVPFSERPAHEQAYVLLFSQALRFASMTPMEVFARDAAETGPVQMRNLTNGPGAMNYRGKPMTIRGRLKRLTQHEAPVRLKPDLAFVYEGWVLGHARQSKPWGVVFTDLPSWLEVKEELNEEVSFHGYFLQNVRYKIRGGFEDYPLLVGRTIIREKKVESSKSDEGYSQSILVSIYVGMACTVIFLFLMAMMFWGADRRVESRLKTWQEQRQLESLESVAPPESPPLARPVNPQPPPDDDAQRRRF